MGQTGVLQRVDGATAAAVLWDLLPYWMRAQWGTATADARDERLLAYVSVQASPVALEAARDSARLPAHVREAARARLAGLQLDPALLARLRRQLERLLARSRKQLLVHLSTGTGAGLDPELDRVDLMAELVALRGLKSDVASERSLARAFRAMFATRDPWALYVVTALLTLVFLAMSLMPSDEARGLTRSLALYPNLERPWTLLTYAWLHVNAGHLTLNLIALILVGHVLEQVLGHARFLLAYLACAVGAGLISVVVRTLLGVPFWTVGASGTIAAMAGLALFLGLWFSSRYGRLPIRYVTGTLVGGLVLASNMLIAATGGDAGSDHGAHVGGLAIGLAVGFLLRHRLAARADLAFTGRPAAS